MARPQPQHRSPRDGKAAAAAQEPLRAPSPLLPSLAFGDKAKKHSQDGFKDKGQDKKGAKSGGREAAAQKPRRGLQLFSEVNTSNVRVTRASLHAFVYILYWTSYVRWRFSYDILYFQVMDANPNATADEIVHVLGVMWHVRIIKARLSSH